MRAIKTASVAVTVLALTTACGGEEGPSVSGPTDGQQPSSSTSQQQSSSPTSSEMSSSSTTESETSSSTSSRAPANAALKTGDCIGPKSSNYPKVDCATAHDFEVMSVVKSANHSGDLVKRGAWSTAVCNAEGGKYLGNEGHPVSRITVRPIAPTADAKNASQIVCLAGEYRSSLKGLVPLTGKATLKNKLKGDSFFDYRICAKNRVSTSDDVEVVPCSEPHSSEGVGGRLNGKPGGTFPGEDKINPAGLKYCVPLAHKFLGTKTRKDIVPSINSGGPGPWSRGQMITGCFVEVTSGTVKKSLKGITTKSIASYR